jgi:hypothetical protein
MDKAGKKRIDVERDEIIPRDQHRKIRASLFLLQVNCRIIYNKSLELWNLVDKSNPAIIGTESWLREEIRTIIDI